MESEFKKHRRKGEIELRPVSYQETRLKASYLREHYKISISPDDIENGSPKLGDMIARNPNKPEDKWLVNEQYYKENYELIDQPPQ